MTREQRIQEIEDQMKRLKSELSVLKHNTLDVKEKLVYPYPEYNRELGRKIVKRYIQTNKLSEIIRLVIVPEYTEENLGTVFPKKIKDLNPEEYKTICDCVNDCIAVINRYAEDLHPEGIAWGEKYEGSFYREKTDEEEIN